MKKKLIGLILIFAAIQLLAQSEPWIRISPTPIESNLNKIIQIPNSDRIMAIGSGASIMYSDDMGENWHVVYKPAGISRFITLNAIHFVDSNIGFIVGSKSTILKTYDGGFSWTLIPIPGDQNITDVFFHTELIGSIIKPGKILKTVDGCQTWNSISVVGSSLQYISDSIGFIGSTSNNFYNKTENAGDTWFQVEINPVIDNFKIESVEFVDPEIGYICGYVNNSSSTQYILKTANGGNEWSIVHTPVLSWYNDTYFINQDTGFAIGGTWYHDLILKTFDGGNNWSESTLPFTNWYMNNMIFDENGKGLCIGDYGQILESNNWGDDWITHDDHKTILRHIKTKSIIDDSTIVIGGDMFNGDLQGTIYRSADGGENWVHSLGGNGTYGITSIFFPTSEVGYACGPYSSGNLMKSINGGVSWFDLDIINSYYKPYCVYFINDQVGFVGGEGDDSGCYKTVDGGISWYSITGSFPINYITDFAFVNDSTGWAIIDESVILKTIDQGETWEILEDLGYSNYLKIKFISDSIGFIVGNSMHKTINGGDTWYIVENGLQGYYWMRDIEFPTPEIGYLTVDDREETLLKSIDGGESWFPLDFPCTSTATCVGFFNENEGLVMGENGIIFRTFTGGIVDIPELSSETITSPELTCYPNPVIDILNVKINKIGNNSPDKILIYSYQGILQMTVDIEENQESHKINIGNLDSGIYFVASFSNHSILETNKIIILR